MTTSECASFLEESEKKRSEGRRIRDQGMLALVPCLRCSRASEKCWVGANSKKCAYCTENITLCTVNPDRYRPVNSAKAMVDGTQPPRRVSPEQESEEALREEAERLYAMNPSWHVKESKARLSSLGSSASKPSNRKRHGKRIRDERRLAMAPCLRCSRASEYCWVGIKAKNCAYCTDIGKKCTLKTKDHTVVDENHCMVPKKRSRRLRLKSASKPVNELQEIRPLTPETIMKEPGRDEIEGEPEATSGSEYQPDSFNSGSESPYRIKAERQPVEDSEGGYEEEASSESPEDIATLRRKIIELRREMKEMRQEFRNDLQEVLQAREHKNPKIETEIIDLEDD